MTSELKEVKIRRRMGGVSVGEPMSRILRTGCGKDPRTCGKFDGGTGWCELEEPGVEPIDETYTPVGGGPKQRVGQEWTFCGHPSKKEGMNIVQE